MTTFAIQHGATPLCTWDLDSGQTVRHERAIHRDDMLVLSETEKVGFVLDPTTKDMEHRIFIGDVPLGDVAPSPDDATGVSLGGKLYWRDLAYFDSGRGQTRLVLQSKSEDAAQEMWITLLAIDVYVLPSKLGEDRYQAMTNDLQDLSRSLLVDLYGKSRQTYDVRFAKEGKSCHSRDHELRAIETVVDCLGLLLDSIGRRPASRVQVASQPRRYWGREQLSPSAVAAIARSGVNPAQEERPLRFIDRARVETFDVPEHRVVRAFLGVIVRRAKFCAEAAQGHVRAITSERHLRHIRLGEGPTIYESVDLPRIGRLQDAIKTAHRSVVLATAMMKLPFLRNVPSEVAAIRDGAFQRNPEYRALLMLIRRFLVGNAIWYEGDDMSAVTKLTWRIFEQWCYLRIVDAFRSCGVDLREWSDALRQNLRSRFIVDFDRGLMFEGVLGPGLRLRFRYEPWILGQSAAAQAGETLCRGTSGEVAWCPDIVIECLRGGGKCWQPVYGIVLDCKYSARVSNRHWSGITKYLEIRSTETKKQLAKQLWLISPSSTSAVSSEDPAVSFSETGPSCDADEAVRFRLSVSPYALAEGTAKHGGLDAFGTFAQGTINFLRRQFGAGAATKGRA